VATTGRFGASTTGRTDIVKVAGEVVTPVLSVAVTVYCAGADTAVGRPDSRPVASKMRPAGTAGLMLKVTPVPDAANCKGAMLARTSSATVKAVGVTGPAAALAGPALHRPKVVTINETTATSAALRLLSLIAVRACCPSIPIPLTLPTPRSASVGPCCKWTAPGPSAAPRSKASRKQNLG
jgi:hypothetical protein